MLVGWRGPILREALADIGHHGSELLIREPDNFRCRLIRLQDTHSIIAFIVDDKNWHCYAGLEGIAVRLTSTIKDSNQQNTEKKTYLCNSSH